MPQPALEEPKVMRMSLTGVAIIAGCVGIGLVILAILLWVVTCPTHPDAPVSETGYCLAFGYNWLGRPAFSIGAILLVIAGITYKFSNR
jgi:hypothetical protein